MLDMNSAQISKNTETSDRNIDGSLQNSNTEFNHLEQHSFYPQGYARSPLDAGKKTIEHNYLTSTTGSFLLGTKINTRNQYDVRSYSNRPEREHERQVINEILNRHQENSRTPRREQKFVEEQKSHLLPSVSINAADPNHPATDPSAANSFLGHGNVCQNNEPSNELFYRIRQTKKYLRFGPPKKANEMKELILSNNIGTPKYENEFTKCFNLKLMADRSII